MLEQTFLRIRVLHGVPEEEAEAWSDPAHTTKESCERAALHLHRCTQAQRFHHWRVASRHSPGHGRFTAVIASDDQKADGIQGQRLDSSSRLINLRSKADLYR